MSFSVRSSTIAQAAFIRRISRPRWILDRSSPKIEESRGIHLRRLARIWPDCSDRGPDTALVQAKAGRATHPVAEAAEHLVFRIVGNQDRSSDGVAATIHFQTASISPRAGSDQ